MTPTFDQTVDASPNPIPSAIKGAGMKIEILSKYFVTRNVMSVSITAYTLNSPMCSQMPVTLAANE